jgi:hypothetical protein
LTKKADAADNAAIVVEAEDKYVYLMMSGQKGYGMS